MEGGICSTICTPLLGEKYVLHPPLPFSRGPSADSAFSPYRVRITDFENPTDRALFRPTLGDRSPGFIARFWGQGYPRLRVMDARAEPLIFSLGPHKGQPHKLAHHRSRSQIASNQQAQVITDTLIARISAKKKLVFGVRSPSDRNRAPFHHPKIR